MKKFSKIIVAILLVSILAVSLFACINPGGEVDKSGYMTLVVLDGDNTKEYSVDLSTLGSGDDKKTGLMTVLEYLKNKGELTYTSQSSSYGDYLTQVNGIKEGTGVYVALYTDVKSDISMGEWATTITYKDKTCTSSDFGASSMSVVAGCTIIITKGTY